MPFQQFRRREGKQDGDGDPQEKDPDRRDVKPDGYTVVSESFRHKSRIVKRIVKDDAGRKHEIQEKVVVYWSKAFYEREKNENMSFMEFLQKLRENPGSYRISSAHGDSVLERIRSHCLNQPVRGDIGWKVSGLGEINPNGLTERGWI